MTAWVAGAKVPNPPKLGLCINANSDTERNKPMSARFEYGLCRIKDIRVETRTDQQGNTHADRVLWKTAP